MIFFGICDNAGMGLSEDAARAAAQRDRDRQESQARTNQAARRS